MFRAHNVSKNVAGISVVSLVRAHLMSIRVRRQTSHFESPAAFYNFLARHSCQSRNYSTMASIRDVVQKLFTLSIKPAAELSHAEISSAASWKDVLIASGSAPSSFELIKTLVYKPKTAKTATPVPVV